MLEKLRDGRLAAWYLGAITVLDQESNPERISQAAHSMRELMEKLPDELELDIPKNPSTLGDRVNSLKAKWKRVRNHPEGITCENPRLSEFYEHLDHFFDDFDKQINARDVGKIIQDELDPLGPNMPTVIREERANDWVNLRHYFVDVCHHRFTPEAPELKNKIDSVETFLLNLSSPKSVDSQAEILALIQEAENSGNA